jgi:hypothetical protein
VNREPKKNQISLRPLAKAILPQVDRQSETMKKRGEEKEAAKPFNDVINARLEALHDGWR